MIGQYDVILNSDWFSPDTIDAEESIRVEILGLKEFERVGVGGETLDNLRLVLRENLDTEECLENINESASNKKKSKDSNNNNHANVCTIKINYSKKILLCFG